MTLADLITPEDLAKAFSGRIQFAPSPETPEGVKMLVKIIREYMPFFLAIQEEGTAEDAPFDSATACTVITMVDLAIREATRDKHRVV